MNDDKQATVRRIPGKPAEAPQRRDAATEEEVGTVAMTAQEKTERDSTAAIGKKIRLRRRIRNRSLADVAEAAGLSIGLLSQIERGTSGASIRSLQLICQALNMPIGWVFDGEETEHSDVIVTQASRRRLDFNANGMMKELLSSDSVPGIQLMRIVIQPGGNSGPEPYNAEKGAKSGLVLSGTLGLEVDKVEYTAATGDSFAFDATKMHRFWCVGTTPTELIWAVTPALY